MGPPPFFDPQRIILGFSRFIRRQHPTESKSIGKIRLMQRDQPRMGDVGEDRRAAWRLASARFRSASALAGRQVRPLRRPGSGAGRACLLPWGTALGSPMHHRESRPCGRRENTADAGRAFAADAAADSRTNPIGRQQGEGSSASPSSAARSRTVLAVVNGAAELERGRSRPVVGLHEP